jgi:hypothetical protein
MLYILLFIIFSLNGIAINDLDLARRMKTTCHSVLQDKKKYHLTRLSMRKAHSVKLGNETP